MYLYCNLLQWLPFSSHIVVNLHMTKILSMKAGQAVALRTLKCTVKGVLSRPRRGLIAPHNSCQVRGRAQSAAKRKHSP